MSEQLDQESSDMHMNADSSSPEQQERTERRKPFHDRERRPRPGGGGRGGGSGRDRRGGRRFGGGRFRDRDEEPPDPKITQLISEVEEKLSNSHAPVQVGQLNPFERKQVHRHFERNKALFETKTYRDGDDHVLWIFPVANLKKFVESKAQEALDSGEDVALPPMSSYERFIVHNVLKDLGNIETTSVGEGEERHIEIHPKKFGRGLKRIVKKIKLF